MESVDLDGISLLKVLFVDFFFLLILFLSLLEVMEEVKEGLIDTISISGGLCEWFFWF